MYGEVKLLLFDLGDTLVEIIQDIYEDIALQIALLLNHPLNSQLDKQRAVTGFKRAVSDEWLFRLDEDFQWVKTDDDEYRYWFRFFAAVLNRLGLSVVHSQLLLAREKLGSWPAAIDWAQEKQSSDQADFVDLLARRQADPRSFICYPEVYETLNQLYGRIEMGIISNAFPSANKILEHLNLNHYFKYIFLSHELPWAKPSSKIYKYALRKARRAPGEALFVDDRIVFVEGAWNVRMNGIIIDRTNKHPYITRRISSLSELPGMIGPFRQKLVSDHLNSCYWFHSRCQVYDPELEFDCEPVLGEWSTVLSWLDGLIIQ